MMNDEGTFSTNRPQVVPYDTGKVKIGCRYVPPEASMTDEEMIVQQMLLGRNRIADSFWKMHGEWLIVVAVSLILVWFFR